MSELKDWLNSINFTKEDLSYDVKTYPPYVINRCLSGFIDTVMYDEWSHNKLVAQAAKEAEENSPILPKSPFDND